jgi:hypothetical protein
LLLVDNCSNYIKFTIHKSRIMCPSWLWSLWKESLNSDEQQFNQYQKYQLSPLTLIHWKQNRPATYDVENPCPGHDLGQAQWCGGVQWDSNSRSPLLIAGSYNSWIYIHLFSGMKLANGPHWFLGDQLITHQTSNLFQISTGEQKLMILIQ